METISITTTFQSGVEFSLAKDSSGNLFVVLKGAPLNGILAAINQPHLALQSTELDLQKLMKFINLGIAIKKAG